MPGRTAQPRWNAKAKATPAAGQMGAASPVSRASLSDSVPTAA